MVEPEVEELVAVLETRTSSGFGMLERQILGFGGLRVVLLFLPHRALDTRRNCWVSWAGKGCRAFAL